MLSCFAYVCLLHVSLASTVVTWLAEMEALADVDRSLDVDVGIPMKLDTYDSE